MSERPVPDMDAGASASSFAGEFAPRAKGRDLAPRHDCGALVPHADGGTDEPWLPHDAGSPPPPPPAGPGFWDPSFRSGVARSDIGPRRTISLSSCLYPTEEECPEGVLCATCPSGPTEYSAHNFFSTASPAPDDHYWVLDHNNDVGGFVLSFDDCNSGPPNQSLPITTDGSGVFGFRVEPHGAGNRAVLMVNTLGNPCTEGDRRWGIPYLGFGTHRGRGNGGRELGHFTRRNSRSDAGSDHAQLIFEAGFDRCDGGMPCNMHVLTYTSWPDSRGREKRRMLMFYLGHENFPAHTSHGHWNWPVAESYQSNGGDIAYISCEHAGVPCLTTDSGSRRYVLHLDELIYQASDMGLFDEPVPVDREIQIEGIHWSLETTGRAEPGPRSSRAQAWVQPIAVNRSDDTRVIRCFVSNDGTDHWCTPGTVGRGYRLERSYRVARQPARGRIAMLDCVHPTNGDHMVSTNCAAEGYSVVGPLGHLWQSAGPGRVPLYRCYTPGDHFVSEDPRCGGAIPDHGGVTIGYARPLSL